MTLIPYPNVPAYPGVPPIPRTAPGVPGINISLSNVNAALPVTAHSSAWGILDSNGDPLYSASLSGTLSIFSVSFSRSMNISDFPIEANLTGQGAAFASFNKVWQPANPIVTVAVSGSESDLTSFLAALDAACASTELYTVVTPDAAYVGYSIMNYSYQRAAQRGATMLMVEISLQEILQVQPNYSNPSSINTPQSASAASQVNGGLVQSSTSNAAIASGTQILGLGN